MPVTRIGFCFVYEAGLSEIRNWKLEMRSTGSEHFPMLRHEVRFYLAAAGLRGGRMAAAKIA